MRTAIRSTIRIGLRTTGETFHQVVDGTIGRFLDTDPQTIR